MSKNRPLPQYTPLWASKCEKKGKKYIHYMQISKVNLYTNFLPQTVYPKYVLL